VSAKHAVYVFCALHMATGVVPQPLAARLVEAVVLVLVRMMSVWNFCWCHVMHVQTMQTIAPSGLCTAVAQGPLLRRAAGTTWCTCSDTT
jgi:hypothetical protein